MKWGSHVFANFAASTSVLLALGFLLYGIGAVFNIISLKGGDLSIIFPIFALNYIWVSFLSAAYLGEPMNMMKWLGIIGIVLGISLIGMGSGHKRGRK
jgi:drug/metabolite transporter (DMT)-like permease